MSKLDKKSITILLILTMIFAIICPTVSNATGTFVTNPELEDTGVKAMSLGNRVLLTDGTLWKVESTTDASLEDTGIKAYNYVYTRSSSARFDYYAKLKNDNTLNIKVTEANDETKVKQEKTISNVKKIVEQYDGSFLAYLTYENDLYFLDPYQTKGNIQFNRVATGVEKVMGQYFIKDGKTYLADGTKVLDKVITAAYKDYCAVGNTLYEGTYYGEDSHYFDQYATDFKEFAHTENTNGWMTYIGTDGKTKGTGDLTSSQTIYTWTQEEGPKYYYLSGTNVFFKQKSQYVQGYETSALLANVVDMNMIDNNTIVFVRTDGTVWANTPWKIQNSTKIVSPKLNKATDINTKSWYYNSVKYVFNNGIMTGLNETTFAPSNNLTRGQMVTLLYKMEGQPEITGSVTFPDVPAGKFYYNAVKWASDNNIVTGYANGNFGPTDNITRAQLAVILYRFAQFKGKDVSKRADLTEFPDNGQVASWAQDAVKWAIGEGIITGNVNKQTGVKTIDPKQNATRAQVATMMERYCKNIGR